MRVRPALERRQRPDGNDAVIKAHGPSVAGFRAQAPDVPAFVGVPGPSGARPAANWPAATARTAGGRCCGRVAYRAHRRRARRARRPGRHDQRCVHEYHVARPVVFCGDDAAARGDRRGGTVTGRGYRPSVTRGTVIG